MRFELVSFGVVALVLAGCGGVAESGLFAEAGASGDTSPPAKQDGGGHVTIVGGDAGVDAAKATVPDTQSGVPDSHVVIPTPDATEPMPEAATPIDTGTPPPPVQCLNGPCSGATPVCCVTEGMGGASGECTATAGDCSGQGTLPISCESSSACSGGICCVTMVSFGAGQSYPTGIACSPSCNGNNEAPICTVGGTDCPQGKNCNGFGGGPYGTCAN